MMSFFKCKVVQFQMIVLVSSLLLITGCVSALSESEMPVASNTVEAAAPQNEIRINEGTAVNETPNKIADHQGLAEYQFRLSGGEFGGADTRGLAAVEGTPDQIADRQALAEYQALVGSNDFNVPAEYQRPLAGSDFSHLAGPKLVDVVELPDQIPDYQALAEYQFRRSGGALGH